MPNKASAKKYLRKTKKRTLKNRIVKNNVKKLIKSTRKLITSGKIDSARESLNKTIKALDQATQNRVVKKNTASRRKSRLTIALNKITAKK